MLLIIFSLFAHLCGCINGLNTKYQNQIDLQALMNDDELDYYFGPRDKRSRNDLENYEIIDLPSKLWNDNDIDDDQLEYSFNAFGYPIELQLRQNKKLFSPSGTIVKKGRENLEMELGRNCHYLHSSVDSVGAVSNCFENEINGILMLPNATLEIRPLTNRLQSMLNIPEALVDGESVKNYPHIVKRATMPPESFFENDFNVNDALKLNAEPVTDEFQRIFKRATKERKATIEVGVFFDEAGYDVFAPYFNYDDHKLRDMILAYMNGVQALYHHSSLGTPIDITIVYLEIMENQPNTMPHYDGERNKLLDSFCDYQKALNPNGDKHPGHWDMALYISGLDFFAMENGRKSGITMGLATVGGVCIADYACIIAEFGTTNIFGKPYPSAGFTSVYIMAHEIGHNLGMHHDSSGNNCPKDGFVMSPSRGTQGETTWSSCSADVAQSLNWARCLFDKPTGVSADNDAWRYYGFPGQTWTAKRQCELLLIDKDAYVSQSKPLESICQNLQCRTPQRTGFYSSGPALDGTDCGPSRWCTAGSCVKKSKLPKPVEIIKGGWSNWKISQCSSGCVLKSKGYQERRRACDNPPPQHTDEGCDGNSYDVILCDDTVFCSGNRRKSIIEYASKRCEIFSLSIPAIDSTGKGLQAPHETHRLWMACAIFCKRHDTGAYYTPRIELNDIGVDAYFPDGTWCHNDGRKNYYCLQHHCLPENFQMGKISKDIWALGEDIPIPGNAVPYSKDFQNLLMNYLSLDAKGRPMLTHIDEKDVDVHLKEDWPNDDYLEMPEVRDHSQKNINSLSFM